MGREILKKKYKGLGFVESLIAIMVSGIVATVLINISVVAMRELVRLDIEDAQAHHARSAAVLVQNIADRERLEDDGDNIFDSLQRDSCYLLEYNTDNSRYEIVVNPALSSDREVYKTEAVITDGVNDNEEDYFRRICIESDPTVSNKLLIKVEIGFNKAKGILSNSRDIKDFKYFAVINL